MSVYLRLYNTAIRLGELQAQFKLQISPEEYAQDNLKFGLVEVVYEWAKVHFLSLDTNQSYTFFLGLAHHLTHLSYDRELHLQISVSSQMFLKD